MTILISEMNHSCKMRFVWGESPWNPDCAIVFPGDEGCGPNAEHVAWASQFAEKLGAGLAGEFNFPGRTQFADEADAEAYLAALLAAHDFGAQARTSGTHCYVRFGGLPADGISRNHRDGTAERGVSAYDAYEFQGRIYVDMADVDGISAAFIVERKARYIISGREVGRGSDGEPVLAEAKAKATRKQFVVLG